jgi:hypothetical protein
MSNKTKFPSGNVYEQNGKVIIEVYINLSKIRGSVFHDVVMTAQLCQKTPMLHSVEFQPNRGAECNKQKNLA